MRREEPICPLVLYLSSVGDKLKSINYEKGINKRH